ncbi:hypothetical protein E5676_scaffold289G00720 [Cucumis melo var. makuwa]|uniref:Uncharacterized protein n=1 Tax=Cucumis melo var. makuwa TaxID=1194695 RepID=A0A5D3DXK4_CUCMM|nr:hypothetical protein E6C27_scaffold319G00780 [Cucumis melo var. makuwa]TYK28158.1 hypothetical protein E5676_scaffold289G00720 [Cucumis melo var. makuwa]
MSHDQYLEKVLEHFNMSESEPISYPLSRHFKLSSNTEYKEKEDMSGKPVLVGYIDSDMVGDLDNNKSALGYLMTIAGGVVPC